MTPPGLQLHARLQGHRLPADKALVEFGEPMIRLGLCCMFRDQPIKFVTTTATAIARMKRPDALAKLARLCLANADALLAAAPVLRRQRHRLLSHQQPDSSDQDASDVRLRRSMICPKPRRSFAGSRSAASSSKKHKLRTCFHPDQFVVLNSPRPEVVEASVRELEYQAEVAEWVGADVINIHGGGAYGDKQKALADFARNLERLSPRVRSRLTVENDDKTYTPADLLPVCQADRHPAGLRRASSSLQPGWADRGASHQASAGDLEPGADVPYLQPASMAGRGRSRSAITTSST